MSENQYTSQIPPEVEDMVPGLRIQAGDNPLVIGPLRDQLYAELAPVTPSERLVAGNIVALELDAIRQRSMMERVVEASLIAELKAVAGQRVTDALYTAPRDVQLEACNTVVHDHEDETERVQNLRRLLKTAGRNAGEVCREILERENVDPVLMEALVRLNHADIIAPFETRLIAIEQRRRRLYADYDRLKAKRAPVVEDAEFEDMLNDEF